MIGEEIFDGIEKPENWPANAKECELENIYISLKKFIKDPSYKNKEVLVALADNYDLNQKSLLGLYRYSEYEVTMINFLFIHATAMNCNVPDFILGNNPAKYQIRASLDNKRQATAMKDYDLCPVCLSADFDSVLDAPCICKICGNGEVNRIKIQGTAKRI